MSYDLYAATYEEVKAQTRNESGMPSVLDFTTEEVQAIWEFMTLEERHELDLLLRVSPPRALMPHQEVPIEEDWWEVMLLVGGRGCVRGDTKIYDPLTGTEETIKRLTEIGQSIKVLSLTSKGPVITDTDGAPF